MIHYLSEEDIIKLNQLQIQNYSPGEEISVRDSDALNMTVNIIKQDVFGVEVYPTLPKKAAALFANINKKHIFANANKRTASVALFMFLFINGFLLQSSEEELVDFSVEVAITPQTEETFSEWTSWIESRIKRI